MAECEQGMTFEIDAVEKKKTSQEEVREGAFFPDILVTRAAGQNYQQNLPNSLESTL